MDFLLKSPQVHGKVHGQSVHGCSMDIHSTPHNPWKSMDFMFCGGCSGEFVRMRRILNRNASRTSHVTTRCHVTSFVVDQQTSLRPPLCLLPPPSPLAAAVSHTTTITPPSVATTTIRRRRRRRDAAVLRGRSTHHHHRRRKAAETPARADRRADEGDENSEGDDGGRDKGDGDARGHEGQAPEGKQRPPDRSPLPRCANGADGPC